MRFDKSVKPELFVSKNGARQNLHHVYLDRETNTLQASDGERLIVTPVGHADSDSTGAVPTEALVRARKLAGKDPGAQLDVNSVCVLPDSSVLPRPAPVEFPDTRKVIPEPDASALTINVSAKYLASVYKAVGDTPVTMIIRGPLEPIEFRANGEFGETVLLIMPMARCGT